MSANTIPRRRTPKVSGFMLLGQAPVPEYRGVDRQRFEPSLLDADIDHSVGLRDGESRIWALTRAGWRREAYRIYEENLAAGCGDDLYLLRAYDVAIRIREFIRPHLGNYEALECDLFDLGSLPMEALSGAERSPGFVGYDIAYPGGDCYSAVLNGLLVNPHKRLLSDFGSALGTSRLLKSISSVQAYVAEFRELVPSEANSEFCLFAMFDPAVTHRDGQR
jgi:hypothetical protein